MTLTYRFSQTNLLKVQKITVRAAKSVTFDLLFSKIMFLIFKNTVI